MARELSSCPAILSYVKANLPQQGVLKKAGGFVYVDLDDAYIHKLAPFIEQEGFEEPPYFGKPGLVGAHITVIYPTEMKKHPIETLEESDEIIRFTLKTCQIVYPHRRKEVDEIYLLVVDAPELDLVRKKYGLHKLTHPFHITLGIKPKIEKAA